MQVLLPESPLWPLLFVPLLLSFVSCDYLPVCFSEINWYKEEQQVLYRAVGHVTNLQEVVRQGWLEGLIECVVIPYLRGR